MGGTTGRRFLAPISSGSGTQFRFLFQSHRRSTNAVMRDTSIAWASCSSGINKPGQASFTQVTTRMSAYGVMNFRPMSIVTFKKPCSEDKTFVPKQNTGANFGNPALPINRR